VSSIRVGSPNGGGRRRVSGTSELSDMGCQHVRVANVANQLRVSRLKELDDSPNSNVLECGVRAGQEAV